jgi:hypothetical protein
VPNINAILHSIYGRQHKERTKQSGKRTKIRYKKKRKAEVTAILGTPGTIRHVEGHYGKTEYRNKEHSSRDSQAL